MRSALATIPVCFASYLLFAGTLSLSEAATGVVLGIVGGGAAFVLAKVSAAHFTFSAKHGSVWVHAMAGVPSAAVRTCAALLKALVAGDQALGRADERPFHRGERRSPRETARRATTVLAASLAPDSFVVHVEPHHDTVLLHSVGDAPPAADAEWLA